MSANLPIEWADKKNSPLLADFIAKYGAEYCMTAEEINQLRNAVNEMALIQQSTFLGAAEPAFTPAGTGRAYWVAVKPGAYPNHGGVVVGSNEIAFIIRDTAGAFSISQTNIIVTNDKTPSYTQSLSSLKTIETIYGNKTKIYGYNGVNTTYASGAPTRINEYQIIENLQATKISLFCGAAGDFKILELTKNIDGTFNYKQLILSSYAFVGYNEFAVLKNISSGSYIAFYAAVATISYASNGNGFSSNAEINGNNFPVGPSLLNWNFQLTGISLGIETINSDINKVYNGKIVTYGNPLNGVGSEYSLYRQYVMADSTAESGTIKKIKVKVVNSGYGTFFKFKKLPNGKLNFAGYIGDYYLSNGENEILISQFIEKNINIGFYSDTCKLSYNFVSGNTPTLIYDGYSISENVVMAESSGFINLSLDIEAIGISKIDTSLNSIENDKLEGLIFGIKNAIPLEMTQDGWVDNSSPSVVNSILYSTKKTGMDKWIGRAEIKPLDASVKIVMAQGTGGIYVTFDFALSKIQIHSTWDGVSGNVPAVFKEGIIPFPITTGKDYIITVEKSTVKTVIATISNKITAEKFTVTDTTTGDAHVLGVGSGSIGLIHKSGSYNRNSLSMATPQKTRPKLMIYGDSFCAGYNLIRYGFDINARYPQLLSDALNGDVSISAIGGEDTWDLIKRIETDFQITKPKYTLLAIGLNDDILSTSTFGQFKANMTKLINTVVSNGSIPIMVTYPRLKGNGIASQFNSYVRNYSGLKYVDIQMATSVDGSESSVPDTANLFLPDGHPNVVGNLRIFNKFKLDVPELFYE